MKITEIATKEQLNKLMERDQQMIPQPDMTISFPDNSSYEVAKIVQDFISADYKDAAVGHLIPVMTFKHEAEYEALTKFLKSKGIKFKKEK